MDRTLFLRICLPVLGGLLAAGCHGPDSFVGPGGEVFDGVALRGISVSRLLARHPDRRIPVTANTRLTNLVHIDGAAFLRAGVGAEYGTSADRSVVTTNFLQIHDISTVARTNIKEPIEQLRKTNCIFRIRDNFEYTFYHPVEAEAGGVLLRRDAFSEGWAHAAHRLHELVARFMYREPGRVVSLYIKDLAEGHEITYNPHIRFFGCSMLKMYVMAAVFARFEENDRRIATNEALIAAGAPQADALRGAIAAWRAERSLYEAFMYPMVVTSDNPQYGHFRQTFGDDHFADYVRTIGYTDTTMRSGDRDTTAADLGRFFDLIHEGGLFHDPYLKRRPFDLFRQAGRYGVAFHLPAYVPFVQKRGLRWHFDYQARHITGILFFKNRPVVVSVTSANPFFDYDAFEDVTDLSSRVARMLYHEVYQRLYRAPAGETPPGFAAPPVAWHAAP